MLKAVCSLRLWSIACVAAVSLFPFATFACPGCIEANEANREAFLFTTGLLTLIPLIVIGCIVRFLQLRAKRLKEENAELATFNESPDPTL